MYIARKISCFNLVALNKVSGILYRCGKDMAHKQGLHHWDNTKLKTFLIVLLCVLKNKIYLVYNTEKQAVATFQVKRTGEILHFSKLATDPYFSKQGIGSYCMQTIEQMASASGCTEICMEVYDKSNHARAFYEHRGYVVSGTLETLKYTELR